MPEISITRGVASLANVCSSVAVVGRTGEALPPPVVPVTLSPLTVAHPTSAVGQPFEPPIDYKAAYEKLWNG